jgi:hypothetical protein
MIVLDAADLDAESAFWAGLLGGRLLKAADDPAAASGAQVYADPAGHPFCLCWLPAPA